ncbi:MAG TPA: toll/interleukin-1 receptor domain-containing protein [Polyangiaceae bacterium]
MTTSANDKVSAASARSIKVDVERRFAANLGRVQHLGEIYQSAGIGVARRAVETADVLRSAVVFLHAALEDFLRTLLDGRTAIFMPAPDTPIELFRAHAHKGRCPSGELHTHLASLIRGGLISVWHDRKILPGADWTDDIHERLHRSEIILLLISPGFIASDYCY